ncbi:MAG: phosphopentomutase [Firmicutes bacterium HGW-Firmicutes-12]|nr:MAG: phosphopentomutase [Firmicutes bacterium HGW-Firmicutes-12]
MKRVLLLVLDSVGVGELPDAHLYGDKGSNTLGHIVEAVPGIKLPNLSRMGLGKILPLKALESQVIQGAYGKMAELSKGKDTTTGHWEIAGVLTEDPMPTFPEGFPSVFINAFEKRIKRKVLGNIVGSGTEIIVELGAEHLKTGYPIVYTSADSVFQIAAHEEVIPLAELYEFCKIAREMLTGPWAVGRVIARPFEGSPGSFKRTSNRHDYSLMPPQPTILDALKEKGYEVIGVGKISDIFAGRGLTESLPTSSNLDGFEKTKQAWSSLKNGLVFVNLVEFDSSFGHRNDPVGYANALEDVDRYLPELLDMLGEEDLLIITADHGNDPTTPSTDHNREYVPLLVYAQDIIAGTDLGIRRSFSDIAATISEIFELSYESRGESFLSRLYKES